MHASRLDGRLPTSLASFVTSSDQLVQLFGDVALFTHSVRIEITTNEGPSSVHERETIVFRRQEGRWIAVHEHLPPAAAKYRESDTWTSAQS